MFREHGHNFPLLDQWGYLGSFLLELLMPTGSKDKKKKTPWDCSGKQLLCGSKGIRKLTQRIDNNMTKKKHHNKKRGAFD